MLLWLLHSLSTGTPFTSQVMDGLGVPLALQVSTPLSPGARTRFLGAPSIQYGAAEKEREGEGWRINHCPAGITAYITMRQQNEKN